MKILLFGTENCHKQKFIDSCRNLEKIDDINRNMIGVDFLTTNYQCGSSKFMLQIWSFSSDSSNEKSYSMHDAFCLGAHGAIAFIDDDELDSSRELNYWIDLARKSNINLPIILCVLKTKSHFNGFHQKLNKIVEKNGLQGYAEISLNDENPNKMHVFDIICDCLTPNHHFVNENDPELPKYSKFYESFATCPICGSRNHEKFIRKFFFSHNPRDRVLKEDLLDYMEKNVCKKDSKIKIGIPCCECYKEIFKIQ